jgi:vacuolar-type H+-ATPase subunit E/Vma4
VTASSGDLSPIIQALLQNAHQEAEQKVEAAEKDARAEMAAAEEEAQRLIKEAVAQAEISARREAKRKTARAELQASRLISAAREEIIGQSLTRVRQALGEQPHSSDYPAVLEQLVNEAVTGLSQSEIVLHVREEDRLIFNDEWCRRLGTRLGITISVDPQFAHISGGMIVSAQQGRLRFDQSFETLLSRHEDTLRSIIAQRLWEPSTSSSSSST